MVGAWLQGKVSFQRVRMRSQPPPPQHSLVCAIVYPWSELNEEAVICDVGGNNGHMMLDLIKAYPKFKVVVQDIEAMKPSFEEVSSLLPLVTSY